jgi:hypothetical protein
MRHKEPGILKPTVLESFMANKAPYGQQFSIQWPTEEHTAEFDPVLDFTVTYLAGASWSLPSLMRIHPEPMRAHLHFVVALRRPVARARSMFCMFAPGKQVVLQVLRNEPSGIVEAARQRLRDPDVLVRVSELNDSVAQGQEAALWQLRRLLFPWVGEYCSLRGWGWESRTKNLSLLVREELEQLSRCSTSHRVRGPHDVHQMSTPALETFVADCHRDSSHYNCARFGLRERTALTNSCVHGPLDTESPFRGGRCPAQCSCFPSCTLPSTAQDLTVDIHRARCAYGSSQSSGIHSKRLSPTNAIIACAGPHRRLQSGTARQLIQS